MTQVTSDEMLKIFKMSMAEWRALGKGQQAERMITALTMGSAVLHGHGPVLLPALAGTDGAVGPAPSDGPVSSDQDAERKREQTRPRLA